MYFNRNIPRVFPTGTLFELLVLFHACHMSYHPNPFWHHPHSDWKSVQIMKLFLM